MPSLTSLKNSTDTTAEINSVVKMEKKKSYLVMLGIFSVDVWCLHVSEYSDITDSVMQSCCKELRIV